MEKQPAWQPYTGGWLKLHRKIKENPIFRDSTKLHLWVYCLVNASHTGHKTILGRREVFLQPGQFVTGRHRAATETGLTEKQVRAGLKALERLEMVKLKTSQGQAGTIVTICSWQFYQHQATERGQERAREGPSEGQVGATTEEWEEGGEVGELSRARESARPPIGLSSCERQELSFSPHYQQALDAWREEREKVGLTFVADPQTKDGARIIAGMIENGQANLGAVRKAMENLLANEEARSTYTLKGLANNLSTWIDGGGKSGGKTSGGKSRKNHGTSANLERGNQQLEGL